MNRMVAIKQKKSYGAMCLIFVERLTVALITSSTMPTIRPNCPASLTQRAAELLQHN